ncbi:MAG: hypothetical protein K2J80_06965, partial [Oscillospiraceae bacterium]|nr:hypothetical protein [Oscillospiraceae bacterium]
TGGYETKAATCTYSGFKTYTCTGCSQTKTEDIKATGHNTTKTAAKAATCTTDGNKEYWYCSTCKKYFSNSACTIEIAKADTVITKLGHSYSSAWTTDGTNHWHKCTNTGCTTVKDKAAHSFTQKSDGTNHWQECACGYTNDTKAHTFEQQHNNTNHWQECPECNYTKGTTAHSLTYKSDDTCRWQECDCGYVTGSTDHTFTLTYDNTNHWYECDTCHYKKSETAHTLTAKKNESTHWQECTTCGYKEGETEHEWGGWSLTVEPSVNTTGTAERACSCGGKQTKTDVPALTDASVWTKDETTKPTISGNGSYTYTSEYGEVTAEVPELKDTEVWTKDETTKPTITDNGEYTYTSDYGTVTVDVPKLSDEDVWSKDAENSTEPTINADGSYTYTSDYGTITENVPKLTDPSWTKTETKKPAMDTDGEYTYTSEYGTVTVTVPKLSDEDAWSKDPENSTEPTINEDGSYTYTGDYGTVTVTVPELSDPEVWTKDPESSITPTESQPGKDVYTSDYGVVEVALPELDHTHVLTYVPEVPATENNDGIKPHWHCDGCDKDFFDENGENEATADDLKIGKLEKEVHSGENAPAAELKTPLDELVEAVLTPADQEMITTGVDIKIILTIDDGTALVSAEDKAAVETAIGGLTDCVLGQYLDVNLLKIISGKEEKITEAKSPITVTFELPESLRGDGRNYSVIRVHNGETAVLPDLDDDDNTITVKTDKFSTYALAYSENTGDTSDDDSSDNSDLTPSDESKTTDSESSPAESSGSSDSDTASTGSDNSDNTASGDDDNNYKPGESYDPGNSDNHPTGITISLIPLTAAIAVITVMIRHKKRQ